MQTTETQPKPAAVPQHLSAPIPTEPVTCQCGELAVPAAKWANGPRVLWGSYLVHHPDRCEVYPLSGMEA